MASEMVRVEKMDEADRELIGLLSPEERLAALREAGRRKVAKMHAQHNASTGTQPTSTYTVKTSGSDLSNNYNTISEPWEFIKHEDDGTEVWEVKTERPKALESMLDTDDAVVSYDELSPAE